MARDTLRRKFLSIVPTRTLEEKGKEKNSGEERGLRKAVLEGRVGSNGLEVSVGHASGKEGAKRRFHDACDTESGEAAEEGPHGDEGGVGGEQLKDKRQKETTHKHEGFQG